MLTENKTNEWDERKLKHHQVKEHLREPTLEEMKKIVQPSKSENFTDMDRINIELQNTKWKMMA